MDVFKSNGYPENFINNCFKAFLDSKHRMQEKVITVPKKPLFLVLPYLGPLSLSSAVNNHLVLCSHSPSFKSFSVLTKENRKFVLELKEGLLIMRDKLSLNRIFRSVPLYLFDRI